MGNQLFRIMAGYGIGRSINRVHVIRIGKQCSGADIAQLRRIISIFPKMEKIMITNVLRECICKTRTVYGFQKKKSEK